MLLRVASWLARINNGLRPLSRRGIGASLFRQPVTECRPDYQRRAVEAVTVAWFEPLPLHPDPKFEGKFGKIVGGVSTPPCGEPQVLCLPPLMRRRPSGLVSSTGDLSQSLIRRRT